MYDVAVVGSIVIDLISYTEAFPSIGETKMGINFQKGYGGKGANQCVMAKFLGANCIMIGKVGGDFFGVDYMERFKSLNIDTDHIGISPSLNTGVATIIVRGCDGANQIVITPGANYDLLPGDVEKCRNVISKSKVLLCQMEVPLETSFISLKIAKEYNVLTIFNPAPMLPESLKWSDMPSVDIFCPNETEASILTNIEITDVSSAKNAIKFLFSNCFGQIKWPMITMGHLGVVFGDSTTMDIVHVPAPLVQAIDTTGAGDCFAGSLAYYCAVHSEMSMLEKVQKSIAMASLSVQKCGTQASFPDKESIAGLC